MACLSILTLALSLTLFQSILGQTPDCKCGGTYANGKAVSGCVKDRCAGDANRRCVTIFRDQTAIGYDCLAWPSHIADCATFDDGSRVCASSVCKPTLLGGAKEECPMANDDSHHAVVAAQINKNGLDFVMNAVKQQVAVQVAKIQIPNQQLQQSGFDVKVDDIKIAEFVSPTFSYLLLPPSSMKVMAKGGDFKVCAKWEAKKSFINPGGDICVWSEGHKGVEVEVTVKVTSNEKGQLRLSTSDCKLHVPIDMKLTGALGTMVNLVSSFIENAVQNQASTQVCKLLDDAMKTTVAKILDSLPTHFKIDEKYGVGYAIRGITFTDSGVKAQVAANATFSETS